ncbi:TetR/AcrR family transcriptional regulator [Geodermatophilus marinus]|uniref:TetR/AcrR family transcriptional regulator n=1 Tax=Geodermatophilus sp. LHW52908 TaxID=2303986 RepID=UPI001314E4B4|nr:TetR/AcrR family transcriptional regulator [Geodermatophilus sp. LHW52908]
MTRVEQAAATRAALLAAARAVFLRSGYHGTTVDAVAQEAGFTTGAIYARFAGKADLFLALLEERVDERSAQLRALPAGDPLDAGTAVTRQWARILRSDLDWTLLVVEFRVHAARDPGLAARFAELHGRLVGVLTDVLARLHGGQAPRERYEALARAGLAMGPGAALARAAEGEAFSDELMEEVDAAVAARLLGTREGAVS